jgi:hypothetical protein
LRAQRRRSTSARVPTGDDNARKKRRPANNLQVYLANTMGSPADETACSALIGNKLDALLAEAGAQGMPPHEVVRAVMTWAAEQSYQTGGYSHTKSMVLDTLETVLILDAAKKRAA